MANEVDIVSQESLRRYFEILRKKGYYNYEGVYRIILLTAIQQLINSDMAQFITPCDKKIIDKALNSLYCSICPIPTPQYIANTDISVNGVSEDLY